MLDKKTTATLKILNAICEEGTYKVIDYNNLISKFPNRYKVNKEALDQNLEYLKTGQYIDIKYAENDTYCLCVLPKGRMILEDSTRESKTIKHFNKMLIITMFVSGIMAFLGAFLAIFLYGKGLI